VSNEFVHANICGPVRRMTILTMLEAVNVAQREEMKRDPRVFLMGEDIRANMFGTASGLVEEFGLERVRDTPISENGIVGAAAGAAMVGMRPIVDMNIASFLYPAMDQLVSIIAKSTYLYGGQARMPVVIRTTMFYNGSLAAQHSDRPYPMLMGVPGFKIIAPTTPYDMKGLLKAAIRDDDPVLCFEDVTLWTAKGDVPDNEYVVSLGKAEVKRRGTDVTVVAISGCLPLALAAAELLAAEGVSVEVIDPRTLVPMDWDTILESVQKTGRLVAVDLAHRTCSVASEITSTVAERAFWDLKAPVRRVTTPDIPIPFSPSMERQLYPTKESIVAAVKSTMG
jgi:pyruvate/2-oxoglutarate/acetoin dehydrogenase E1 component